jgi:pyrimidine operon attenuation protein/uracil phosphoribosyltransferase
MIDDAATLADWTGRAVRAALDAPAKPPKPARRRRF